MTGDRLDTLFRILDSRMTAGRELVELDVEHGDGATLAWLYAHGEVVGRRDDDSHAHLQVAIEPAVLARIAPLAQGRAAA